MKQEITTNELILVGIMMIFWSFVIYLMYKSEKLK